jgi:uncharacterized phage infection (PIP) family protein YhgE
MATKTKKHLIEELEDQFHSIHHKISNAKEHYLASHHKEHERAKKAVKAAQKKLITAKNTLSKAALEAKKSSSKTAQNQFKKAKAILADTHANLQTAKPFQRKLAARAKALANFEKEWLKKEKATATARNKRTIAMLKRRAALKRKAKASR